MTSALVPPSIVLLTKQALPAAHGDGLARRGHAAGGCRLATTDGMTVSGRGKERDPDIVDTCRVAAAEGVNLLKREDCHDTTLAWGGGPQPLGTAD